MTEASSCKTKICCEGTTASFGAGLTAKCHRSIIGVKIEVVIDSARSTIIVAAKDKCTYYWVLVSKDTGVCEYCGKKRDFMRPSRQSLRKVKSE